MYKWDVDVAIDRLVEEHLTTRSRVPTVVRQLLEGRRPAAGATLDSLLGISSRRRARCRWDLDPHPSAPSSRPGPRPATATGSPRPPAP